MQPTGLHLSYKKQMWSVGLWLLARITIWTIITHTENIFCDLKISTWYGNYGTKHACWCLLWFLLLIPVQKKYILNTENPVAVCYYCSNKSTGKNLFIFMVFHNQKNFIIKFAYATICIQFEWTTNRGGVCCVLFNTVYCLRFWTKLCATSYSMR